MMSHSARWTVVTAFLFSSFHLTAQIKNVNAPEALLPVPTSAQLAWHEMETNAFIHFTINTFTDREWGNGDESPVLFNPSEPDVNQWAQTLRDAGFKMIILTCKHHDGFCLWPSKFTEHSIKNSPFKNGKGDLVKEVSDACKKAALKFGIYVSPWDRNRADYGNDSYINYYRSQLKELFTNYGPVTEMWFDGANGGDGYYGGANETRKINARTYYHWPQTLSMIRKLEPAVIFFSDAGPGVRWVGNERGLAGETNWNTITMDTIYAGKQGINDLLNSGSPDGKEWVPAEVDVSIRPGWFYHTNEDSLVKSPERLFEIYLTSVGRGSVLLLNVPPDRRGLFHEKDVASLKGFRKLVDSVFAHNLANGAKVASSAQRGSSKNYSPSNITDGNKETYWATNDGQKKASFEITLRKASPVNYILLQEYIKLGQRVSDFTVEAWVSGEWRSVAKATTIGYKRILHIDPVQTNKIKVTINAARACPLISNVEIY
jgi:alpha-L-fucosidase